jgi:hypothetical protein
MNLYQPTITGSLSVSGSVNISGSITIEGGGTISGTASIATTALTASSADNLLVRNTLTAQTLVVQTITSSVDFVTGSTRFGSLLANTHVFSGSVTMNPGGLFVSSSGNVGIGTTPNTTAGITELAIGSSNTNPLISGIRDGASAFSLSSDSAGTKLIERRNLNLILGTNNTTALTVANNGAATFASSVAASTSITVTNSGAQAAILSAVSTFADGYRATLRLWNQHTGGKAWEVYSTNVADGGYGGGKLTFVNSTDSVTAMTITSGGLVGIGVTNPSGSLSLKAEVTNTPTIVFQNVSGGPNSAISNFTSAVQTFTVIGANIYVDTTANIARFNTSYAGCGITFDEGILRFNTGTTSITPSVRMTILDGGDVNINGGNIRSLGGGYVIRDSANTTTGGLFTARRNWLGSGTDYSPTIAAETGYGIYTYTNGTTSPTGPYVAPGGTTWTNGSSDVRKKKNFEVLLIKRERLRKPINILNKTYDKYNVIY